MVHRYDTSKLRCGFARVPVRPRFRRSSGDATRHGRWASIPLAVPRQGSRWACTSSGKKGRQDFRLAVPPFVGGREGRIGHAGLLEDAGAVKRARPCPGRPSACAAGEPLRAIEVAWNSMKSACSMNPSGFGGHVVCATGIAPVSPNRGTATRASAEGECGSSGRTPGGGLRG